MVKYVPIETIKYQLSKIRKHSNFNYKQAINRNRKKQVRHPPLKNLIDYCRKNNYSESDVDKIVKEYWDSVEKDNNFEMDVAKKIKMKYYNKT